MDLIVNAQKTILAIQSEFQGAFPYLKLEFYSRSHRLMEGSADIYRLSPNTTLELAGAKSASGKLHIHSGWLVSALEESFENIFGLHVQVFRKSGSLWLQTTQTDHWTLNEQNKHGAEMELPV